MADIDLTLQSNQDISLELQNGTEITLTLQGGVSSFTSLSDTPITYSGQSGKVVSVKSSEDGLEFTTNSTTDENVKISSNDTTSGKLNDKLIVGSNKLSKTINNPSANENISIDVIESNLTLSNIGGSVTDTQVPNTITLDNITQITNRSHTNLSDIGSNTHTQIDSHISSTSNPHNVLATQITDFDTEVSNNSSVTANTAKISFNTDQNSELSTTGTPTFSGLLFNLNNPSSTDDVINLNYNYNGAGIKVIGTGTGGNANPGVFRVEGAGDSTSLHVQRTESTAIVSQAILKIKKDNSNPTNDTGALMLLDNLSTGGGSNGSNIISDSQSTTAYNTQLTGKYLFRGSVTKSGGLGLNIQRNLTEAGSQPLILFNEQNASNTSGVLKITNSGSGDSININTTDFIVDSSGNTVLGKTSADTKLHIYETNDVEFKLETDLGNNNNILFADGDGIRFKLQHHGTDDRIYIKDISDNELLTIEQNGMIGINTINPIRKLHVRDSANQVRIEDSDDSSAWDINVNSGALTFQDSSTLVNAIVIANNPTSEIMRLASNGNVGIGTNNPDQILSIYNSSGDAYQTMRTINTGTPGSNGLLFGVQNSTSDVLFLNYENTNMRFFTNDSERLRIDNSGNIGINETNPTSTLDVVGTAAISALGASATSSLQIGEKATGNRFTFIDLIGDDTYTDFGLRIVRNDQGANTNSSIRHRGTGKLQLVSADAGSISFETQNIERARFDSTGNLGIGLTNPGNKLHISSSDEILARFQSTDAIAGIQFSDTSDSYYIGTNGGKGWFGAFASLNSGNLVVDATGKVLIGTTTSGNSKLRLVGLPTSSAGLSSGDVWNDAGTLKIVP